MQCGDHARDDMVLSQNLAREVRVQPAELFESVGRNCECIHLPQRASARSARSLSHWSSVDLAAR